MKLEKMAEKIIADQVNKTREEMEFILSPADLQDILGMGNAKVYTLLNDGVIPGAKKVMGEWLIPRDTFLTWLYSKEVENESKSMHFRNKRAMFQD